MQLLKKNTHTRTYTHLLRQRVTRVNVHIKRQTKYVSVHICCIHIPKSYHLNKICRRLAIVVVFVEASRRPDVASQWRVYQPSDQEEGCQTIVWQTRTGRPLSVSVRWTSGLQDDRLTSIVREKGLTEISLQWERPGSSLRRFCQIVRTQDGWTDDRYVGLFSCRLCQKTRRLAHVYLCPMTTVHG